ncbi:hypothetical protein H2204_010089 [Knufia peltigerae]|uniref:Uncharacterized protein n=1 Tax=Knufia peltigerae TaxID=1002370 RepID=A0AA38XWV7_9EURO|nr:hypothetical protein H2204_010089 [Knufia peltigerae]
MRLLHLGRLYNTTSPSVWGNTTSSVFLYETVETVPLDIVGSELSYGGDCLVAEFAVFLSQDCNGIRYKGRSGGRVEKRVEKRVDTWSRAENRAIHSRFSSVPPPSFSHDFDGKRSSGCIDIDSFVTYSTSSDDPWRDRPENTT